MYYLKELNVIQFKKFLRYSSEISGKSKLVLLSDAVFSVFRFNTSLSDYFHFRFYSLNTAERSLWAGTGFMYEYQLIMNPPRIRQVLENKVTFNERFSSLIKRNFYTIQELAQNPDLAEKFIRNTKDKIVLKYSQGQAGKQIKVLDCKDLTVSKLLSLMRRSRYDIIEEYIVQHPVMMSLSPSGINTVRIITQLEYGNVKLIAARLRISINSEVDNMAAGNAAAPVDMKTGKVTGPAVFSDITKEDIVFHPITNTHIPEFKIPFWAETIMLVNNASTMIPENRSVGWDVAITSDGPVLIEGNHNWCKLLWQLPAKKGLKPELTKYL